jgi:hypothetical protein
MTERKIEDFYRACEKVSQKENKKTGIGTLREKTVHAVVKEYLEPRREYQEIKVGSFFADIYNEKGIFEIQTRNFRNLRKKLDYFLKVEPVTIVYPVPYIKQVRWLDEETGELSAGRKSPKKGSPALILYELYQIKEYLLHPNLSILILLMNMEETKLLNGWSYDKKRGATRYDRIPTALVEEILIETKEDYEKLLPKSLPKQFTAKEFQKAARLSDKAVSRGLQVLMEAGVIERIGKKGRAYLYER